MVALCLRGGSFPAPPYAAFNSEVEYSRGCSLWAVRAALAADGFDDRFLSYFELVWLTNFSSSCITQWHPFSTGRLEKIGFS
eukprot:9164538-Pyramimonas_sp.AAC.2